MEFFLHKSIHWESTKPGLSRRRFNNQGRNELQKLKGNRIAKAGDYKARRWGLTEFNILKQTYIHNELVNSVQCFWKRLPFQQAKRVFKDGSADGFPNKISVNHFISPNLFCEEEQLFISIKPCNRWLAGGGGGGGGLVRGCRQWSPWKGGFPDNKTLIRAREWTLLSVALSLLFGNSRPGRERRDSDHCFGKDPAGRLWGLVLGKCWTTTIHFLGICSLKHIATGFLKTSCQLFKTILSLNQPITSLSKWHWIVA